jgi:hypothetical protein
MDGPFPLADDLDLLSFPSEKEKVWFDSIVTMTPQPTPCLHDDFFLTKDLFVGLSKKRQAGYKTHY